MTTEQDLQKCCVAFFAQKHNIDVPAEDIHIARTNAHFPGDITITLFSLAKKYAIALPVLAQELGTFCAQHLPEQIETFAFVKGFLNVSLRERVYTKWLETHAYQTDFHFAPTGKTILIEYASPNTNKPLHLGHLRNIFLGASLERLFQYAGNRVASSCVVNDRGIHICKSMLAWKKWGQGEQPQDTQTKGDHFVGKYYVLFAQKLKEECTQHNLTEDQTELMRQARHMLVLWENNDPPTRALWQRMNSWVYEGFDKTFQKLGITFDKTYYESDIFSVGKQLILRGKEVGVFDQRPDGSIWVSCGENDHKLLLRADGTSVYITQDIGLAVQKYQDYPYDQSLYVVGDEQNYHFATLKTILDRMEDIPTQAKQIVHVSYGMVTLTTGKMKSREGTVVDADDLIADMEAKAQTLCSQLGKARELSDQQQKRLHEQMALGALRFFLLRTDPKHALQFDPAESIDFQGFTGTFLQYTHARICSLLAQYTPDTHQEPFCDPLHEEEKKVIVELRSFGNALRAATQQYNPAVIAAYAYQLAKYFNTLYAKYSFLQAESADKKRLRHAIATRTQHTLLVCARLLCIELPERM